MKILVVGAGGREHALAWKLKQSPLLTKLYCVPGNPGTAAIAENVDLDLSNLGALALWAVENEIDLTVVGPEAPLAAGLVNIFSEHGLKVFGPSKEAARLESSKSFAKEVMQRAGVKTAQGAVFSDLAEAKAYVREQGAPIVVKADGLAAGKGVVVCETLDQALDTLDSFLTGGEMGDAGKTVVVEECLRGRESSVMAVVDSDTVLPLVVSQDYKRLLDGGEGPNTGGMGAISPSPVLADERIEGLVEEIFLPVIGELSTRGISYTGFLYAGVMVDDEGNVQVLEFNCRLGDPETQVLMMRLESDLLEVLLAAVEKRLPSVRLKWTKDAAACVVASSKGYPKKVDDDKVVSGLFSPEDNRAVFQAGTRRKDKEIFTKGGRVLAVAARGKNLADAVEHAYQGIDKISFDGMHCRKDIGKG